MKGLGLGGQAIPRQPCISGSVVQPLAHGTDLAVVPWQGESGLDELAGQTHGAGQSQAAETAQALGSVAIQSCCPCPKWHLVALGGVTDRRDEFIVASVRARELSAGEA